MKSISVVAAIIIQDGRLFATQRGYGDWKDWWEFPGGKIEPGEAPEDALAREIREELDTEIEIDRFLCTVEHDYPTFHLSMRCYVCHVVEGDLVLKEHEAAAWVDSGQIWDLHWLPADIEVLKMLEKELN